MTHLLFGAARVPVWTRAPILAAARLDRTPLGTGADHEEAGVIVFRNQNTVVIHQVAFGVDQDRRDQRRFLALVHPRVIRPPLHDDIERLEIGFALISIIWNGPFRHSDLAHCQE